VSTSFIGTQVTVPKDKYLEILGFTIYAYLTGKITPYSGLIGGKRSLGEYIENFIYGKVAEVALQIFLMSRYGLETLTDLDLADFIEGEYLPDIIAFRRDGMYEQAHFWVEVKEVRRDQRWLLIPAPAVRSRPYDAYVAVWVGLPDEHLAWLVKYIPQVQKTMGSDWQKRLQDLEQAITNIECRIIGFAPWNHVELVLSAKKGNSNARNSLNQIYGQQGWDYFDGSVKLYDPDDPSWKGSKVGENVGFLLSRLARSSDWKLFVDLLLKNQKLVGSVPPTKRSRRGVPSMCGDIPLRDYRDFFDRCLARQLASIRNSYGTLKRNISWFQQPLH